MPNNVVIQGFNSLRKIITKGFVQFSGGVFVKICRIYSRRYISQSLQSDKFICQRLKIKYFIMQSLKTNSFVCQKLKSKNFISQTLRTI